MAHFCWIELDLELKLSRKLALHRLEPSLTPRGGLSSAATVSWGEVEQLALMKAGTLANSEELLRGLLHSSIVRRA